MKSEAKAKFTDRDLLPPALSLDNSVADEVQIHIGQLQLNTETLEKLQNVFEKEMELGIKGSASSLQMENTYIPELPDGTEEGKYLALDLGGTNFRVLLVEFNNGRMVDVRVKHYHVAENLRLGHGDQLFDFLADCILDFVHIENIENEILPLGFTFSFPMVQHSLRSGILVTWTKSFNCPGTVNKDAAAMLNESLKKKGSLVEVHAILNDTTGTLLMGAILDRKTAIGLILGTGSNACYLEKADKIKQWGTKRHGEKEVIIDLEWGAFGDNGAVDFIKTIYDKEVDKNSLLVGSFTFEKYISGKYMGEIVRSVLVNLAKNGLLFQGEISEALNTPHTLTTENVSKIEEDGNGVSYTSDVLRNILKVEFSQEDIKIVQYVCRVVSNRSALLVSTLLAFLLDRMEKDEATIAIDGSLCEKHPKYRALIEKYIALFTQKKFNLVQVSDGSGKGAATAVAIAMKLEKRFGAS